MTKLTYATSPGFAEPGQAGLMDPHLAPFLLARDESRANEILATILEQHARPIIERVAGRGPATEDVRSEILTRVMILLRECKAAPMHKPIANFSHYVAVLAANVCREEQRRLHPLRRSLKDALRHTLTGERQLGLWQAGTTQLCGLAAWLSSPVQQSEKLDLLLQQPQQFLAAVSGNVATLKRAELLLALFSWLGHPLVFDDLVSIVAALQGIKDEPAQFTSPFTSPFTAEDTMEDRLTNVPAPGQRPDEEAEWRAFLAGLWAEIEDLPPLQRLAYLLNFTDGEIEWFWFYGIASLRRIGKSLQLTKEQFNRAWVLLDWREEKRQTARSLNTYDEQFALLWQHLPLNDLTIAALLETTRQNVINLRQAARKRLRRKMIERQAISPADSRL